MTTTVYELFAHPTAAYRGKPFWSWNGKLQKDELLRQIRIIKEMGFGGFFMHSRTGLATEYLGDEWFELINACSEEAERLGMEAWLYDEDRWPSGTAGGIVTQEPEYRLKFIKLETMPAKEFIWRNDIFAAFMCDLGDLMYANCTQIQREQGEPKGEGKTILAFSIVEQAKETFYNGYTYLDTLNPEAVERFLEVTHEKYKAKSGQHFGKAIKGIFTDEPHRGALLDGFGIRNENGHWHLPWTYTLFERFQSAYGYDLAAHLPELFLLPQGKAFSQVKWHYVDLVQNMFHDSFAKPINEWCEKNGLILTGHTLHEDSLTAQTAMVGSVMRFYEHMGYPGVDVLTEGNVNYWIVKQLSSAARQLGKTWTLSELYGCTGWQMPLEGHKAVGDWQALFGINLRCHHLSWYSMAGESKRDYPASIFHQSAWWREYRYVETYFSRLGVIMTSGKPLCDLLVLNPVESLWGQIYPGWSRNLHAVSSRVRELEQRYQDNFLYLAGAQIDFDYGDEDMLSRMYCIGKDNDGETVLQVGQAAYRAVIVTGMVTMRASSLRILQVFRDAGGKVIFAGDPPDHIDALVSDEARRFAATVKQIPFGKTELLQAVKESVRNGVCIRDAVTGAAIEDIFAQVRLDGDSTYVVLMNMNRKNSYANVVVSMEHSGSVEAWDCATGARKRVPVNSNHGTMEWVTHFAPVQEHVYVVSETSDASLTMVSDMTETDSMDIEGPYAYRLDEPNVCVLDRVTYCLGNDETTVPVEILKADRQIRSAMQLPFRHGEMVQPWYQETYGNNCLEPSRPLVLHYRFHIVCMPETPLFLAIERPECFQITINGESLDSRDRGEWWIDRCFVKIPLPLENLREGENILTLRTMFHQDVPLEAVYVLGEFGVSIEDGPCTLIKLPEKLEIGSVTEQGLPFYGGTITYRIGDEIMRRRELYDVKAANGSAETAFISFSSFEASCIKVRQGKDEQWIAWQPYEKELDLNKIALRGLEADLILTRRNTFGPLHQIPLLSASYGPGNWTTEGEHFTETYALLPSGLLSVPRLVFKKDVSPGHQGYNAAHSPGPKG